MAQPNWYNLAKNATDPQTIGEAILEYIAEHNSDVDAHLGAGESLQSHRASDIIDHIAESVVNDKIKANARAYVAIVDPSSDSDFDTIAGAVSEATSKGGGNIFIKSGTHYLGGKIDLPCNINLIGEDKDSVFISGGKTAGDYLNIVENSSVVQQNVIFNNLTFVNTGGGAIFIAYGVFSGDFDLKAIDCNFTGGGVHLIGNYGRYLFEGCNFELNNNWAIQCQNYARFVGCSNTILGTPSAVKLVSDVVGNEDTVEVFCDGCDFGATFDSPGDFFKDSSVAYLHISDTTLNNWRTSTFDRTANKIINSVLILHDADTLQIGAGSGNGIFIGNTITSGDDPAVEISSDYNVFIGNKPSGTVTVTGAHNKVLGNTQIAEYSTLASSATFLDFRNNTTLQLTPNSTRTLTTTAPPAGQRCVLVILTSGSTSYTMTFGSGFKTIGTLATGATSARRFVVNFVSDGSYLIECSRTTAIA